jgi:hypothetical protein
MNRDICNLNRAYALGKIYDFLTYEVRFGPRNRFPLSDKIVLRKSYLVNLVEMKDILRLLRFAKECGLIPDAR